MDITKKAKTSIGIALGADNFDDGLEVGNNYYLYTCNRDIQHLKTWESKVVFNIPSDEIDDIEAFIESFQNKKIFERHSHKGNIGYEPFIEIENIGARKIRANVFQRGGIE